MYAFNMSSNEKHTKVSKQLRQKALEFLNSKRNVDNLLEIIKHFECGADQHACLLSLEFIFTSLLKEKDMFVPIIPLKPIEKTLENQHKEYLRNIYEECFLKILACLEADSSKIKTQALSTAMNMLAAEGRNPLETKGSLECYVPATKLKLILMKILSDKQNNISLVNKYTEYLLFDDVLFFTWKLLPYLTAKTNPNDVYISNYLLLLEKMQVQSNSETQLLCADDGSYFKFDENVAKKNLNKMWQCVMHWEHSPETHKQVLMLLLEKVMRHLDRPLYLTDFLMDSLDVVGPVSMMALQGLVKLIQEHNIEYPNIYVKLYSMFEPEIFYTKYKARLFDLADLFFRSSHLPENLVAAFAKRLARLALIAPSEDIIVICNFIGNLIIRHPGLKRLLNNPQSNSSNSDPYIMEERDPLKSNAINSSLWEIQTLQNHVQPSVAVAARFINTPIPSVEWTLSTVLGTTGNDIFDREVKKYNKSIVINYEKPVDGTIGKNERVMNYWEF